MATNYTGNLSLTGYFEASDGISASASGSLGVTLYATLSGSGTGTGYETVNGSALVTVEYPGGSYTERVPLNFTTPSFTIQSGSFSESENMPVSAYGITLNIAFKASGSTSASQQTITSNALLTFSASYDGISLYGRVSGAGTLVAQLYPPTITGVTAGQTTPDTSSLAAFRGVVVSDPNSTSETETVTIAESNATHGSLTDAEGGSYNGSTGVYEITGTPSQVTAALEALTFDPTIVHGTAGQTVATTFTIAVTDSSGESASNSTTSVSAADSGPIAINSTTSGQITTDQATISPFSHVTITDANGALPQSVTITLSASANGTLSNLGIGSYNTGTGVYSVSGTAAAVTAAIQALIFTPTVAQSPGQTVTTTFTIHDTDTDSSTATDSTTTVATSDITVILHAASSQYQVADDNGSLYVADVGTGGDGTQTLPGVTVMEFTNGTGVFDPTGTAEQVARLYGAALDRAPDVAGLEYWTNAVDDGTVSLATVATSFTTSPEFISDYGSLSNANFVNQLYENVLGRPADQSGASYWEGLLSQGVSRGTVLLGFAESQEYETDTQSIGSGNTLFAAGDQDNGEIYRIYQATLARAPDSSGLAYWASDLQSGISLTEIAQSFVSSAEFQADYGSLTPTDFVTLLYQNVLGRAPDSGGLAYWTGLLADNVSQATVVLGFSDSPEFRADTASATHANWVFIPS